MSDSQRLRALRDRLKINISFEDRSKSILEILTYAFNGRDLVHVRKYVARLKAGASNPTPEQQVLLYEVEARYAKREAFIKGRAERKKRGEPIILRSKNKGSTPTPESPVDIWETSLEDSGGSNGQSIKTDGFEKGV
jgi:hypothetical protein